MKGLRTLGCVLLTVCAVSILAGCGGSHADENKPMSEVQAEAQNMDASGLRDMAMAYKNAIQAKMGDIDKVKDQLKEIPPMQLMGEEAKKLKEDVEAITKSANALKDRFEVYYDKLKQDNGDLSGLDL